MNAEQSKNLRICPGPLSSDCQPYSSAAPLRWNEDLFHVYCSSGRSIRRVLRLCVPAVSTTVV